MIRQVTTCDHCKKEITGSRKPITAALFPWCGTMTGTHFCNRLCLLNWLEADRVRWTAPGHFGNENGNTQQWMNS